MRETGYGREDEISPVFCLLYSVCTCRHLTILVSFVIPIMWAVIDTNVWVAALRSRRGAAFELLKRVRVGAVVPVVTVALFLEYEEVLKRPAMVPLDAELVDRFLDLLLSRSATQKIFYTWRPVLGDADDDMLLEAAVAAGNCVICTFNTRHFRGSEKFGVTVLTPHELLERPNPSR